MISFVFPRYLYFCVEYYYIINRPLTSDELSVSITVITIISHRRGAMDGHGWGMDTIHNNIICQHTTAKPAQFSAAKHNIPTSHFKRRTPLVKTTRSSPPYTDDSLIGQNERKGSRRRGFNKGIYNLIPPFNLMPSRRRRRLPLDRVD